MRTFDGEFGWFDTCEVQVRVTLEKTGCYRDLPLCSVERVFTAEEITEATIQSLPPFAG